MKAFSRLRNWFLAVAGAAVLGVVGVPQVAGFHTSTQVVAQVGNGSDCARAIGKGTPCTTSLAQGNHRCVPGTSVVGNGNCFNASPTPSPVPSSTPNEAFKAAVLSLTPYYFVRMSGKGSTEPDLGSGGNPATYTGAGSQGGAGLENDADAGSYSPLGTTGIYAISTEPMASFPTTNSFSVVAWLQANASDCTAGYVRDTIVSQFNPAGPGWGIRLNGDNNNDGNCFVAGLTDGTNDEIDSAAASIIVGTNYFVALTYNKSSTPHAVFYLNAVSQGTNGASFFNAWSSTTGPIVIGASGSTSTVNQVAGAQLFGQVGDVAVFSTTLTGPQVSALYTAGTVATPSPAPTPTPSPTPAPTETLPPTGTYTSCEPDTVLVKNCEPDDLAMTSIGITREINYIGLLAHKVGTGSLASWLAYDSTIGMKQFINVKNALSDSNLFTGTALVSSYPNFSSDCGATNDAAVIQCVVNVVEAQPGYPLTDAFAGFYVYDEPGCPDQTQGFCVASLGGGNYQNVNTLSSYIESVDSHPMLGIQTPSGPPCGGGGFNCAGGLNLEQHLYSCDNQPPCVGVYPWISSILTPNTGLDYYPIAVATSSPAEEPSDIGPLVTTINQVLTANYPAETLSFTGQAFSWFQEGMSGCTSITVCPYPTEHQMQSMRDYALYWANASGRPLNGIFWYYWADINCVGHANYSGCSASANKAALQTVIAAPVPVVQPTP